MYGITVARAAIRLYRHFHAFALISSSILWVFTPVECFAVGSVFFKTGVNCYRHSPGCAHLAGQSTCSTLFSIILFYIVGCFALRLHFFNLFSYDVLNHYSLTTRGVASKLGRPSNQSPVYLFTCLFYLKKYEGWQLHHCPTRMIHSNIKITH